jgi:hypothetical protein
LRAVTTTAITPANTMSQHGAAVRPPSYAVDGEPVSSTSPSMPTVVAVPRTIQPRLKKGFAGIAVFDTVLHQSREQSAAPIG